MAKYKSVDVDQLEADLTIVADSIRAKAGTTEKIAFPSGYKSAIDGIAEIKNQDITIIENGTYTFDSNHTGLGTVVVNIPNSVPENGHIYYSGTAQSTFDGLNFTTNAVGELSE